MSKQKDAVFSAIAAVKGTDQFTVAVTLDSGERATVTESLLVDFKAGNIDYNGELNDEDKLRGYVSGLISNWLRKDTRLNGGKKYTPQNPGSRVGAQDESVKAMRQLQSTLESEEAKAEIQLEIVRRVAELKPKPQVDVNALPESLRHLAS